MKFNNTVIAFLALIMTAALASFLPGTSEFISASANHLYPYPGTDIHGDYFIGSMLALLLGLLLALGPFDARLKPALLFVWTLKVLFALGIMLIFEFYYGLDSDGYYLPGWTPPMGFAYGKGTHNVRLICWALFKVIGSSYHGGKVALCFLSLMGCYLVYRGAMGHSTEESPRLLLFLSLSPTMLFWSSLLGKDPIAVFISGIYAYGCLKWLASARKRHLVVALAAMGMAAYIRAYFIPIMAIPLGLIFFLQTRRPMARIVFLPLILGALMLSIRSFSDQTKVDSFESFVQYEEKTSTAWATNAESRGGSTYALPKVTSPLLIPILIPFGIFTALFRPLPFEAHNPFALAASFDNTILLILALYAVRRSRFREFLDPKVVWGISYVCLFSAMYGLGAPNLGALSRFKIQALPIFIAVTIYLARPRVAPSRALAPRGPVLA